MKRSFILVGVLVFAVIACARLYSPDALDTVEDGGQAVEAEAVKTVKIGLFSSTEREYEEYVFLGGEALRDINKHCNETGNGYRFELLYGSADGSPPNAKNLTIGFHGEGAEVIVGYGWCSFFCSSGYTYCKENNMTIVSPSCTSPLKAIKDHVYRLCPTDTHQVKPITRALQSLGVTDVVILQRGDYWGDEIVRIFKETYLAEGGSIRETVRYPSEATEFTDYLEKVDAAVQASTAQNGANSTAVLLVSFNEAAWALRDAAAYPGLFDVPWIGTEGTFDSRQLVDDTGPEASSAWLASPHVTPSPTPVYQQLNASYASRFGRSLGLYTANVYDCCWVAALSVMEADARNCTVNDVLPEVAAGYTGATGLCRLDENGDRETVDYEFRGYYAVDGEYMCLRCGTYRHETDSVEWTREIDGQ
ncbi:ABC transporter substrate-binding protein [Candidatus Bathyarchaeota archaeon]|nr:ABC transporter substrate-binding protein [Candidatus Bathyarchaeota archaeon]